MELIVPKSVVEPHIVYAVVTCTVDIPTFTVTVARFIKLQAEKGSIKEGQDGAPFV